MSAVKLEKALSNLELRLREDFTRETKRTVKQYLKPLLERIRELEQNVHGLERAEQRPGLVSFPSNLEDSSTTKDFREQGSDSRQLKHIEEEEHSDPFPFEGQVVNIDLDQAIASEVHHAADGDESKSVANISVVQGVAFHDVVGQGDTYDAPTMLDDYDTKDYSPDQRSRRHSLSSEVSESTAPLSTVDSDMVEEPVAFLETAWNLVLVLGHTRSGPLDVIISVFLLVASAVMQVTFFIILLDEDFLGEPFEQEIAHAITWRDGVAHDYKYMDLAGTSLVSRVCNDDGKLILSTQQASLLKQINAFMGLENGEFHAKMYQPGTVLCMMCILLWCLYLVQEFRAVLFSLEAVGQLPKGPTTIFSRGNFKMIGYGRFAAYCLMRLMRLSIAVGLLYAGCRWLAGTTSITELILNAVALAAVLEIDEMVFAALMPKKIQICIQDLEAIKVRYSRVRSQVESAFLLALIFGLMLWPYVYNVGPLAHQMLEVKKAYCAGNQDFVVGPNTDQKVTVGMMTVPYAEASTAQKTTNTEFAVSDQKGNIDGVSKFIKLEKDFAGFNSFLTQTMGSRAWLDSQCIDWDTIFLTNATHELQEFYSAHFWSAVYWADVGDAPSCADMAEFCDVSDGVLVRYVCPNTCGCASQYSQPWFKVGEAGCSRACENGLKLAMRFTPCEDVNVTLMQPLWDFFWDNYITNINAFLGTDVLNQPSLSWLSGFIENVKTVGCQGLLAVTDDPLLRTPWCEGSTLLYRGLAYLCPDTCGCRQYPTPEHCPRSCEGCKDAADFPGFGQLTNCAMVAQAGLCQLMPTEAAYYCAETCGMCNMLATR